MRIVEIIPLTKIPLPNPQILTYFTNKVNVKRGGLVMAPLGKRKTPAIVINSRLLENEKMSIRKADFQLSPIKEVLSAKPVISQEQLELAFWMHEYYYEPLGLILKSMLPRNIDSNYKLQITNYKKISNTPVSAKTITDKQIPKLLQSNIQNSIAYFQKGIEKTIKRKKQVLILAPEINILDRLQKKFRTIPRIISRGSASVTSRITQKQFQEIWQKTAQGKIKIIFGTRKALFLPFRALGLVILAEEHNPHYKSWDQHPKYHARETAKKLAESHNAKIIMQSETPSIETKFKNQKSKCKTTVQNAKLRHDYKIVDMRNEMKAKNYSIFSRELLEKLKKSVEKKEKIILFINRRGEASAILCRDCGHIVKCKNCEAPMVMHSACNLKPKTYNLTCHHCGYKENAPNFCPNCRGHRIKFMGGGTEKVEEELRKIFPGQKISRLDSDTAKTEKIKKDIIKKFNETNGILIGTQLMASSDVSKADFLGIINSDAMLNMPDFRSGERIFQTIISLLGKIKNNGKVIYQTYSPDHYAIKYALKNDYENFYKEELKLRKLFNYPPFSQIIKLTFSHKNKQIAEQEAKRLYEKLSTINYPLSTIIGPAPAFIPKKRGKYGWHIIIKINSEIQNTPHQNIRFGTGQAKYKILQLVPSNWEIDVDPESLL